MLAVACAGEYDQIGVVVPQKLRGGDRALKVVYGNDKQPRFTNTCGAQDFGVFGVAIIHLITKFTHKVHAVGRALNGGKFDIVHAQYAPNNLSHTAKACDNHRVLMVGDGVVFGSGFALGKVRLADFFEQ